MVNIYKSTNIGHIIANMEGSMWKNVEISLSRGNNIQEVRLYCAACKYVTCNPNITR